ncbi:MAG: class I SAM-dependent methyltransferase [Acidobacteriota bacterium]|nr:class I SAM-dependent methyltransferase [Acidobacteriota bacterium]
MIHAAQGTCRIPVTCKVCDSPSNPFGETEVIRKFRVEYFRCQVCGFIQTEQPYWLEEAYSTAIAQQDVGIMRRNLVNCELTSAVINLLFPKLTKAVDYGAGHGVLVRLMRDRGFDFRWYDRYATNDYARGFEYEEGSKVDFLTAFEVLEHLTDPISDLSQLMELSDNVLVSTCVVPEPVPSLMDWWYFVPTTGQHIALYTPKALQIIADRFGRRLLSHGPYHLFTKEPQSKVLFGLATRFRVAGIVNRIYTRPSLIDGDFRTMTS